MLGAGVQRLREGLREPLGWAASFGVVHHYLRARWEAPRGERPRAEVVEAWRWMARRRGTVPISEVAGHVALSHRQLDALFRRDVGLGPKAVSRLLRFHRAKDQVTRRVGIAGGTLGAVAHDCGYADQSHLVRDFRQYLGLSPTQWLWSERQIVHAAATPTEAE